MSATGKQLLVIELNSKIVALMGARQFIDDQVSELEEKLKELKGNTKYEKS